MKHVSNLTSKGQVTIPKDIRDRLGLKSGQKVRFDIDEDGNARILRPDPEAEEAKLLHRLEEFRAKFKAQDPMPGMDGLEYQRWIREKPEV